MQRLLLALVIASLVLIVPAASADEHEPELPEHPHMLVHEPVVDFSGEFPLVLSVRKCVDLAANNTLALGAHHQNVHFGTAGAKLFDNAGHAVVPAAPFPGVPWSDCASFLDFYGLG